MFWRSNRLAFAWALLILILCGIPGNNFPKLSFLEWLRPDKIIHLILFGVQSYLFIKSFSAQSQYAYWQNNAECLGVILSISYGVLVEILQTTIFIGRSGDYRDAIANAIGALLGLWIYKKIRKRQTA